VRLLADENVPAVVITQLREAGHHVVAVAETAKGLADKDVLALARRDELVLLTFDKDFGELAARGVVLVRLGSMSPGLMAKTIVAAIACGDRWSECFTVIEPGRVRMIG
jgi:predicted nuclease of predicted toxin-antitoxin system